MFTRSHTMITKKLGHRLSMLIAALCSLIPIAYSLIPTHIIPLFQVFLSQNVAVPGQKLRCSKSVPGPFQRNSRFCSKFVPSSVPLLLKHFPKSLICPSAYAPISPLAHSLKLHQNYTKITPKLA